MSLCNIFVRKQSRSYLYLFNVYSFPLLRNVTLYKHFVNAIPLLNSTESLLSMLCTNDLQSRCIMLYVCAMSKISL